MIAVPFLVLFFVSLVGYVIKSKVGVIAGALCGIYAVFMIWVAAGGWEDASDASWVVTINGRVVNAGVATIFILLIWAAILIPLMIFAPMGVAYLITHFIEGKKDSVTPSIQVNEAKDYSLAKVNAYHKRWADFGVSVGVPLAAFVIGITSLIVIQTGWRPSYTVWEYINVHFATVSILGLLLAICTLIVVRSLVNLVVKLFRKNNTSVPHP